MVSGSIALPYAGYFSPFPHGTCSLSVSQEYLALPDGAGRFTQSFTGFALLRYPNYFGQFTSTGLSPSVVKRSMSVSSYKPKYYFRPYNPSMPCRLVWAVSSSLATTKEITLVFSSSSYLDVSVHWVCFFSEKKMLSLHDNGLPHSDIYGCNGCWHLTVAFRS